MPSQDPPGPLNPTGLKHIMTFSGEYVGLKMTLFEIKLKFYQNDTFRDQGELWPTKTVPFGIKVKFGQQNFTFWASEIKNTQTPRILSPFWLLVVNAGD